MFNDTKKRTLIKREAKTIIVHPDFRLLNSQGNAKNVIITTKVNTMLTKATINPVYAYGIGEL
jgi:hypothetical protein